MKQIRITPTITNRDDESLKRYFKDIYKYNILTLEEEINLSKKIKKGDQEALKKLIYANLRFVITVAKQYQGQGLSLSDLINEGNLGMLHAAERYDGNLGYKFISYAVWWIRQAIVQAIYNTSKTIRFPVTQITKLNKINKSINKLENKYERIPTLSEISKETNLSEDNISNVLIYNNSCVSMDIQVGENENSSTFSDLLPSSERTDESLMKESIKQKIDEMLSILNNREHDIIRMFFGLGMQETSLEEIGNKFGMTGERIRQLKEKALDKLKEKYSNELTELL